MNILLYSLAIVYAMIAAFTNNIAPLIAGLILVAIAVLSERIGK
jgi:hypothetical protein